MKAIREIGIPIEIMIIGIMTMVDMALINLMVVQIDISLMAEVLIIHGEDEDEDEAVDEAEDEGEAVDEDEDEDEAEEVMAEIMVMVEIMVVVDMVEIDLEAGIIEVVLIPTLLLAVVGEVGEVMVMVMDGVVLLEVGEVEGRMEVKVVLILVEDPVEEDTEELVEDLLVLAELDMVIHLAERPVESPIILMDLQVLHQVQCLKFFQQVLLQLLLQVQVLNRVLLHLVLLSIMEFLLEEDMVVVAEVEVLV